jgi:hypothetical protein
VYVILIRNKYLLTVLQIRASAIRRTAFASTQQRLGIRPYELLRDVETRWSSTYIMIERAQFLREVSLQC